MRRRRVPNGTPMTVRIKFHSIADVETGCWLWIGALNNCGYGLTNYLGKQRKRSAHRASYEAFVGPIPEGLTLDHLCNVRHCVNPAHLEPVTNAENCRRAAERRRLRRNAVEQERAA